MLSLSLQAQGLKEVVRMRFFHGGKQRGPYFEGWYLKHQSKGGKSLALIPAFHRDSAGRPSASLQIISDSRSWWLE